MTEGPDESAPPGDGAPDTDPVDERIDESFPASDPPVGWAGEDPRDVVPEEVPPTGG
jgi:hypothetical protein